MTASPDWDAIHAIAASPCIDLDVSAWRVHWKAHDPTSWEGSLHVSGRYNCGPVEFPNAPTWPALYLSLLPEICWAEITRHSVVSPLHNEYLLSEIHVHLSRVVDCRDPVTTGLDPEDLIRDEAGQEEEYTVPRRLAAAALAAGVKGIIVPSATLLGDNLIIFPDNLEDSDGLTLVRSRPMRPFGAPT